MTDLSPQVIKNFSPDNWLPAQITNHYRVVSWLKVTKCTETSWMLSHSWVSYCVSDHVLWHPWGYDHKAYEWVFENVLEPSSVSMCTVCLLSEPVCVCVLTQAPQRSGHALNCYLSQERGMGRLLGGYSSADREEQHAQSEVGEHCTDAFSHNELSKAISHK